MTKQDWMDILLILVIYALVGGYIGYVMADEPVRIMQYNEKVRIVLSNKPCPMVSR